MSRNHAHAGPHPLTHPEQDRLDAYLNLIDRARSFAFNSLRQSRERSIVMTKLDEAALWGRRAVEIGEADLDAGTEVP